MTLQKENAVMDNRKLMGATDPKNAEENTIRKLYGISIDKNSVHGSDSVDNAKIEIDFFDVLETQLKTFDIVFTFHFLFLVLSVCKLFTSFISCRFSCFDVHVCFLEETSNQAKTSI